MGAQPIDDAKPTSPWMTAPALALSSLQRAIGPSSYRAYAGACTWANGVYWLRMVSSRGDGLLVVENLHKDGKLNVPLVQAVVEADLVYPLIRGKDIARWRAEPSAFILVAQDPATRKGFGESQLKVQLPHTFGYLKRFETLLRGRAGYKKYFDSKKDAFYSMYDVAHYTFAPYRVMWRQMLPRINAVVAGSANDKHLGKKVTVTQHVVTLVPFDEKAEAHYFCALMNSSVASYINASYSTSKSYGTPSVLEHIAVPKYDAGNATHQKLSGLGLAAHQAAAKKANGGAREVALLEAAIDSLAAELWNLKPKQLRAIQDALKDLK